MNGRTFDPEHPDAVALRETPATGLVARRAELQAAAQAAGMSPSDIESVLNARDELPRALLPEERTTLLAVLNHADFDGRDALLVQVESARAASYCGCGCGTVGLTVDRTAPSTHLTYRPVPNEAAVVDGNGEPLGGVILFVDDGYLSSLEVYSYDDPVSPFPPLDRLQLLRRPS
jgi:hypothetical protein